MLIPDTKYLQDHAPLSTAQASTLTCSGITAFDALRKAGPIPPCGHLLVIGAGGVGLSAVRLAMPMLGMAPLVAEPDQSKWTMAREAGPADMIDPMAPGAAWALVKTTGGGVAAVVDFAGSGQSFEFGMAALGKAGRLVVVGLMGGSLHFSPALLPLKAAPVMGSYVGSLAEMQDLMQLAQSSVLPPLPIQLRKPADANSALDGLRGGRARGRLVISADV